MAEDTVVIVGAGMGGLAAALLLAGRGLDVLVLEKAATPGGKMREVMAGGRPVDSGPTVLTMRWVFDALLEAAGARLDDHVRLVPAGILARHAWSETERLDLHADPEASAEAVGAFAGSAEARRFRDFCRASAAVYRALEGPFIRAPRPSLLGMPFDLGLAGAGILARSALAGTMMRALGRQFRDPRLVQLFGRYATYCGSSPYRAPPILTLVAHVEQQGVSMVAGGMHQIARALAGLVVRRGGRIRYGAEVRAILTRDGRLDGVRLAGGEAIAARTVLFNGDAAALATGLLGPAAARAVPPQPAARRSLSAVTWSVSADTTGFPLVRHSVFFSRDYQAEFDAVFRDGRLPGEPTVYVCAQDRLDGPPEAPGPERLLVLVNAPATGDARSFPPSEIDPCRTRTFAQLARCGLAVHLRPEATVTTTPAHFARMFPGTGGALYGPANHGWLASFRRPGSRTALPGLYLAGGSVHPGPGVPMAALSGMRAAEAILADRIRRPSASTVRSPRAAMSGGTSTA
ncbi:1-hydroxycarotenoid 3,4-desaturase CrtD [Prosthecomicrobium sp. N25]|uniref:1-hydroxycarotenoid 3,4-desaturase CrtD n=1 Tax=Prosthecomicrobium sp. N25 TaxID=3129254 RepID=UPI003077017C